MPQLQWQKANWDPLHAWITEGYYRGGSQAQMAYLRNYYQSQSIASQLTYVRDIAELNVHDATQQDTYDIWEMPDATETPSILEHPTVTNPLAQLSDADLAVYKDAFNSESQGWPAVLANLSQAGQNIAAGNPSLQAFYNLNLRGHTNFRKTKYALRHKTNCPNNFQGNVADVNVNCIYGFGTFITEVTSSSLWAVPLYPWMQYKVANIVPPAFIPTGFAWGWLKSNSSDTFEANTRIGITTEYELDLWSTTLYPLV